MHKLATILAITLLTARLALADTNATTPDASATSTPSPAAVAATPPAAPAEPAITRQEVADNFLHIQEQIHEAQLAIEQNQRTEVEAVQSNNIAMAAKLELLQQNLDKQRVASAEEARRTQSATLYMAGTIGLVGLGFMALMVYFQWRAFTQLAQISQQQHASLAISNGVHQMAAPGRVAVETANMQLLDAVGRLEQRINELEGGQRYLPDITNGKPATAATATVTAEPAKPQAADLLSEGQEYLNANAPLKALESFDKFLAENPDRADGLVKRAAALEKLGRDDEAVDCYNRAIAADNTLVIAHLHKGGLLNRLRRYDEALNCYEQALMAQEKKAVAGRA